MGMLGHSHGPAPQDEHAAEPEVDQEADEINALKIELNVIELAAETTGTHPFKFAIGHACLCDWSGLG